MEKESKVTFSSYEVDPSTGRTGYSKMSEQKAFPTFIVKVRGVQATFNISYYIGSHLGCHSLLFHDLAGYSTSTTQKDAEAICKEFNFDPKRLDQKLVAIGYQGLRLCYECIPEFRQEAHNALFRRLWLECGFLSKGLIFMSDNIARGTERVGNLGGLYKPEKYREMVSTVTFAKYLCQVEKIPCVATPIMANPNYWTGSPTLVQGYIFINKALKGPQVAWDTGFQSNFPKDGETWADMGDHIDKTKNLDNPYREFNYMQGLGFKGFEGVRSPKDEAVASSTTAKAA